MGKIFLDKIFIFAKIYLTDRSNMEKNFSKKQEKILEKALELFSAKGYFQVSMKEIAKNCQISKSLLYYYFTSKKEIYKKAIEKVFQDLLNALKKAAQEKSSQKRIQKIIKVYLEFGFKKKILIRAWSFKERVKTKKYLRDCRKKITNFFFSLLKEWPSFKKKKSKELKTKVSFLMGIMDGLILEAHFLKKRKIGAEKLAKKIFINFF